MKKRFKRIYIEITNNCNLSCSFCTPDNRKKEFMEKEKFKLIISKIKDFTDYIYLHIKGEPLLHPDINEFINFAHENNLKVNLTTNGSLIGNLKTKHIRQINYSMQSTKEIEKTLETIKKMKEYINGTNIYLSLRIWTKQAQENDNLKQMLKNEFAILGELKDKIRLDENIFLSMEEEFIWPDLKNQTIQKTGFCYGLKDQIGILVDGTVVPCCLDHKGDMILGNIYKEDIKDILQNKKVVNIVNGFRNRKPVEELCKRCGFLKVHNMKD